MINRIVRLCLSKKRETKAFDFLFTTFILIGAIEQSLSCNKLLIWRFRHFRNFIIKFCLKSIIAANLVMGKLTFHLIDSIFKKCFQIWLLSKQSRCGHNR
ncbi:hypothetical protein AL072_13915 [Azospirillum thiophilum]|uniref:Uncharacterized protein n=1 Tax=Azospirillum thiophilum TaxID=528244 RepID=A0AAC8VYZ0_9PROT|nr:hypothetical protein AL072_13915 [Azospirillum thiophilum]